VGAFNLGQNPALPVQAVHAAMDTMKLRGPDGHGVFTASGIVLGHRRLSVIDLENGLQPLVDASSGAVIVFNGEIYNFREIRVDLVASGRTFRTMSDTEVLLQAYLEWGVKALDRLSGMYAFAIFEPAKKSLFIARDRLGIKPLFYSICDDRLMFASSMAAILCFPGIHREMGMSAVSHYLTTLRTTLGARTLVENVQTLLPGEYIVARSGAHDVHPRRYWDLPVLAPDEKEKPGLDLAAAKVGELMTQSVREQLISDVPLGGFLSGGIDSSVIASIANRLSGGRFNAYSVGYDIEGYNEWPYVRMAAEFHRMQCREIHLDPASYADTWRFLIGEKGLPVSTTNEIPIYHLAKALRNDFTVALTGEGADELLGGYIIPYFSSFDYDRARHAAPGCDITLGQVDKAICRLYKRPYLTCHADQFFLLNSWISFRQKHELMTHECWTQLNGDDAVCSHYEDMFASFSKCSTFDKHMQVHARVNLEGLLFRVDSSTMAASVEGRVPYTDHRLAEYLFRLPDCYKMDWTGPNAEAAGKDMNVKEIDRDSLVESKILLRRAFTSQVPPDIMRRRKMSFPVPVREWFSDLLLPFAREAVEASPLVGTLFKPDTIRRTLATSMTPDSGMLLWPLVNLCLWQRWLAESVPSGAERETTLEGIPT